MLLKSADLKDRALAGLERRIGSANRAQSARLQSDRNIIGAELKGEQAPAYFIHFDYERYE
jgi:hypothetical protein